jgi:hypothetical protein
MSYKVRDRVTVWNQFTRSYMGGVVTKVSVEEGVLIMWDKGSTPIVSITKLYPIGEDEISRKRKREIYLKRYWSARKGWGGNSRLWSA